MNNVHIKNFHMKNKNRNLMGQNQKFPIDMQKFPNGVSPIFISPRKLGFQETKRERENSEHAYTDSMSGRHSRCLTPAHTRQTPHTSVPDTSQCYVLTVHISVWRRFLPPYLHSNNGMMHSKTKMWLVCSSQYIEQQ